LLNNLHINYVTNIFAERDENKHETIRRSFSVWRSMSLGKLDFVHIDLYIPKDDEWKFVRYIIYNNRARNLKYRKTTYGLTKEELNK
jgi:hypothetical protein